MGTFATCVTYKPDFAFAGYAGRVGFFRYRGGFVDIPGQWLA